MTQSLEELTQALIHAARRAGADAADAIAISGKSVDIDVRAGALEHAERSESTDVGLRVFVGQRQANVSASDTSASTLERLAERAVAMAREAPEDPYAGLADPGQLAQDWDIAALELCDPSEPPAPAALEYAAREAEAAALSVNGVSQVQSSGASYGERAMHQAATNGFSGGLALTSHSIACVAIAGSGTGMERDHDSDMRVFAADLRTPEAIGTLAGARCVEQLGARKPPTGAYPVLFDERISTSVIGHLLSAANGSAVARGASWLRGRLGEDVLPKGVSIVENPHRARIPGSALFDGEGLPTQVRTIVEHGVLMGWTLDLATGRKLGFPSTGNAKGRLSSPPSPGLTNIALTQGDQSRAELIADMGTGLLVTSMIGSTINPNSGDYSRGASGFWVENGQIAYPVNECTIAGSLPEFLKTIIPANDARTHLSYVVPSLLVEGLTLAGA